MHRVISPVKTFQLTVGIVLYDRNTKGFISDQIITNSFETYLSKEVLIPEDYFLFYCVNEHTSSFLLSNLVLAIYKVRIEMLTKSLITMTFLLVMTTRLTIFTQKES